jgi:hypothetical protein
MRTSRAAAVVALAGLLGLLWLEDFAPHTDDGCQVEVHCLACRASVERPSAVRARLDPTPALVALDTTTPLLAGSVADVFRAPRRTRGPPLHS